MKPEDLRALLEAVRDQTTSVDEAATRLGRLPFEDLGFARVDHHRHVRTGAPEVVYGAGKTPEQIAGIVASLVGQGQIGMVTRVDADKAEAALARLAAQGVEAHYEAIPRLIVAGDPIELPGAGRVAVVCAGTSDLPVAEEASRTAELLGHPVTRFTDVGVAGLHRILSVRDALEEAAVVVVVAGMEGALPSVVKGLVSRPVIGVPTSVGFGANFAGVSALLSMINSCSPGITVVNIDNGFGAGYAASLMARPRERA